MRSLCSLITFITCCLYYCDSSGLKEVHVSPDAIGFKREYYEGINNCQNKRDDCGHYIDPHDMRNYVHSSKSMLSSKQKVCRQTSLSSDTACEYCSMYLQRFVGLFLGGTGLKDYVLARGNSKMVTLNLVVKSDDLQVLQNYVETGKIDLSEVNKVLTDIFTLENMDFPEGGKSSSSSETIIKYFIDSVRELIVGFRSHFTEHPLHFIIICVSSVCGITLWQIVKTKSYFLLLFSLGFIVFWAGFGWTWYKMYKVAAIEKFASKMLHDDQIPIYCRPDKMAWYQYIYYSSYEKDCEEFFKKQMIDPIVQVSPLVVLAETMSTFILHPTDKLGAAIGGFIRGLTSSLPWYWNLIGVPFTMLLVTLFLIVIVTIALGGSLKGSFFPFGQFKIGFDSSKRHQICCNSARENDGLIEDVRPTECIDDKSDAQVSTLENPSTDIEPERIGVCYSPLSENLQLEMAALRKRWKKMIEDGDDTQSIEACNDDKISVNHSKQPEKTTIEVNVNISGCCSSNLDNKGDKDDKDNDSKVIELKRTPITNDID